MSRDRCTRSWLRLGLASAVAATAAAVLAGASRLVPSDPYVVLASNELGMHCMQSDFSQMMILPPFNTLRAQVIRRGIEPQIVTTGVTVRYTLPSNTHSADKCNFWIYAQALLGVTLAPDMGLAGFGLAGSMAYNASHKSFDAVGIPLTPIDDSAIENPYPLALVSVERAGAIVGKTQAVVPVSWEMSCNLCHNTPGVSLATDILRAHDRLHGTQLELHQPVTCAACHADPALGAPGVPGISNLSHAMHNAHATRMTAANLDVNCYACHPGLRTQCQRDVHSARGMNCHSCHGDMAAVANPARQPWATLPKCSDCHTAPREEFTFEEPGKLYRESAGHMGVMCVSCHGSPHAITPTTKSVDNLQAQRLQDVPGPIGTSCLVCHTQQPTEIFPHKPAD